MKKTTRPIKLTLTSETVRQLSRSDLRLAHGGLSQLGQCLTYDWIRPCTQD